ncbi:MAG: preprotein translocase subunit SecA [Candidatus Omnitrophota bacterium]|jgi:preprotein translocase subunit SecA|nr:MAG: preprotein translocase subunit SecA [Candidatus Omnitrophota bacterium]
MLGFIKKRSLENKKRVIKQRYPSAKINLHPDIPNPSVNKIVELAAIVEQINSLEPVISSLSDTELKHKTSEFREAIMKSSEDYEARIAELEDLLSQASIQEERQNLKDKIKVTRNKIFAGVLPEAFAVVREASRRTIGLRHFDVQLLGGIVLHEGKIAEMATGEGKTLVATLPAYLNALLGKGVHIVTVNDYLARRDRDWMGPIFEFLGLSVGVIQHDISDEERRHAYSCDITYGTNNEFGFDYLRDNMKYSLDALVQRPFYFAIVDEVDSILIDEARTPLIISGPAEESTDKYYIIDKIVPRLRGRRVLEKEEIEAKHKGQDLSKGYDYMVDEKAHTAHLTEEGESKVCSMLNIDNLHEISTMEWRHHVIQALRAHNLYKKDVDYVIKDGQVIIVDEFTGRMMPGRRWSDGLHQAVEAKEGLKIERENQTLATITFQNYFRMYEKLSGMTGTAFTEANEFKNIYQLDVVVLPTNRPLIRNNFQDRVYKSKNEKMKAVVDEIVELYNTGRPVLVGTISIDKSELLSEMLKRRGVEHQVLNAKYHEMEAQIVAQAGRYKAVTIATNMAGRGTDILLGGNPEFIARSIINQKFERADPGYEEAYGKLLNEYKIKTQKEHEEVVKLGGLHVIGTERHEARRVDNQLRGRCGRQGDPGSSRFYVSFEDDLMRLFGSDRILNLMDKLGLEEGQVIDHPWVSKSIEIAQKRVEEHNFEIRKQLLEYDNVMNKQREIIYGQRRQVLDGASMRDDILSGSDKILDELLSIYLPAEPGAETDIEGLSSAIKSKFGLDLEPDLRSIVDRAVLAEKLSGIIRSAYDEKEKAIGADMLRHLERMVYLQITDAKWKDHLYAMDSLREGIGLRAYGQRDPLIEYKREAFNMFSEMIYKIEDEAVEILFRLQPAKPATDFKGVFKESSQQLLHPDSKSFNQQPESLTQDSLSSSQQISHQALPNKSSAEKVGRNDPCPCGSGKKYKKCCGK